MTLGVTDWLGETVALREREGMVFTLGLAL